MTDFLSGLFNDVGGNLRAKIAGIYVLLIGANIGAWLWALSAFRDYPILLGAAMLAYTSVCATRSTPIISPPSTT